MAFLQYEVSTEIKEQLELQATMVADEIRADRPVNFPLVSIDTTKAVLDRPEIFRDTQIYDPLQDKAEGYYYLDETRPINGKKYRIKVMAAHIGIDGYLKAVVYIFITMAILFIGLGALMNYFISKKIWQPFLNNLQKLKFYSVSSQENLVLDGSDITEFKEMNLVLQDLASGARREYSALKEFTENASHEIQTPLSIIQSRLESVSQFELQPEVARFVVDAKQATHRLSKVNKGLLLLAKLENNAFPEKQMIDLKEVIGLKFAEIEDLFANKGLKTELGMQSRTINANPFLVETMISNMLSNMLAHSPANSTVKIVLDEAKLSFHNEGAPLSFPSSNLFARFSKAADDYKGNGLGLSIVRQICTVNGWVVAYEYRDMEHIFTIRFANQHPISADTA